ncbi:translocation protein sec66 [Lentinula raphanica]|uniref:Translocation protein sec66 n=1 Tax=Lentinula raphanica TaxID=153919 RepID=A0AA38UJR9_9AGAR|nr:translocation protein sec66 [Lentinula raphanica]KAJ3778143.1 translocation protein sec66 [Lentinula raphanica]KAJ3843436.1 translocation protein sec66 [Lentinula raphanica]KAJ3976830.1 translocation protein sec66 [Lentinula raphanica]
MASVLVPVAYILVVFGGLFIFSFYYRKQAASRVLEPYFPSHPERNTYVTLLQKTDPPTPEVVLKSALLRRAMADVQRVIRLREDKPAVQNLMQKGSVGDDLWNSLLAAEKEMEAEIIEVMNEANTFVEGWGPVIFPSANEIIANEKMRSVFEHTADRKAELERRYGRKAQNTLTMAPVTVKMTPSNSASNTIAVPKANLTPKVNGQTASTESAIPSDGETKSGKKGKKRK